MLLALSTVGRIDFLKIVSCVSVYIFNPFRHRNIHQSPPKALLPCVGTDQSEDILCAEFPDEPKWMGGAEVLYYHEILSTNSICHGLCI